ncbi:hypothetical protein FE257_000195 [Aspergillus nanangensis]|uniref:C2H2-type domain-containing protein n=1 Tax=Aspergillus nanangensis TaxID=2582783 RepID=A0AAD4CYY1_ASPNN|nr:hypothetical protein FE257_000195 [Aspergillus nanangensis]
MPKHSKSPVKAHLCTRCDRNFSRLEHLQRHERSHTKEKPYRCLGCPKAFTRKDLLSRHERLAHQEAQPDALAASSILNHPVEAPRTRSEAVANTGGLLAPFATHQSSALDLNPPLDFALDDEVVRCLSAMDDFPSFMDSVPIPTHPFSPTYQPVPLFFHDTEFPSEIGFGDDEQRHLTWLGDPLRHSAPKPVTTASGNIESSLSQSGPRLASPPPDDVTTSYGASGATTKNPHLLLSAACRQRMIDSLAEFSPLVGADFVLPSRHALSRFLGGYFSAFHDHFPFLHIPTFKAGSVSVDLFLAITSMGARYMRESEISIDLFHAAKEIALERIRRHRATPRQLAADHKPRAVELTETVLLLVAITTWAEPESASGALAMRNLLDCFIREEALSIDGSAPSCWRDWIQCEKLKRMLFVAFCFLNIYTIAFDIPPLMLVSEVSLDLPCSEKEWRARDEQEWTSIRATARQQPLQSFRSAFECLFIRNNNSSSEQQQQHQPNESSSSTQLNHDSFSSLGGCALIHALIQQIWLVRSARLPQQQLLGRSLSPEEMCTFETALKRWALYWEQNEESSMDPLSPYGPVAFTSVALLRLAYIRLNLDLGPIRRLSSWDPHLIAQSLHKSAPVQRCDKLTRAALHCAHALSIPVKLGLNHVGQTQVLYWSNQHALCSLECALLLAKWLESATMPGLEPPLTGMEEKLLDFVVQLITDTEYKISYEEVRRRKRLLSAMTVRLWAKLYQWKSVWEMVDLIGRSLNLYADLLEEDVKGE